VLDPASSVKGPLERRTIHSFVGDLPDQLNGSMRGSKVKTSRMQISLRMDCDITLSFSDGVRALLALISA
jgi:hypothetical protein